MKPINLTPQEKTPPEGGVSCQGILKVRLVVTTVTAIAM
jgi:hypothetical protein